MVDTITSAPLVPSVKSYSVAPSISLALSAAPVSAIASSLIALAVTVPLDAEPNPANVCVASTVEPALISSVASAYRVAKSVANAFNSAAFGVAILSPVNVV